MLEINDLFTRAGAHGFIDSDSDSNSIHNDDEDIHDVSNVNDDEDNFPTSSTEPNTDNLINSTDTILNNRIASHNTIDLIQRDYISTDLQYPENNEEHYDYQILTDLKRFCSNYRSEQINVNSEDVYDLSIKTTWNVTTIIFTIANANNLIEEFIQHLQIMTNYELTKGVTINCE
jgi:hypothetical protein